MFSSKDTNICEYPDIVTDRLLIRKVTIDDAQDMYDYSDEDVARYVMWEPFKSVSEARWHIRFLMNSYKSKQPSSYGIALKDTNKLIGTIGFMWINSEYSSAEVGYSLGKEYWNKGIMTEALEAILHHSFKVLNLHRVEAQYDIRNPSSAKVLQKCRMHYEGEMRDRLFSKGEYVTVGLYAILENDFRKYYPLKANVKIMQE